MPRPAIAQMAQQSFGRNRVQYQQLQWQYLVSNHFDVFYAGNSEAYARRAIALAESEYVRITELIGYSPYNRIRFYLYDSPQLLSESNVGLEATPTILGGKTSFLKSIIEVAYTQSQERLRQDIARGLARSMVYDMMYGGSFTEAVQNSYLMMLPEWFTEGAVAYAADGWSLDLDNWARDEALAGRMRRLAARQGQEAERLGQSFWAFVADRYGRANVSNILNLTRIIRNEESAIGSTLGVPYGKVVRDWRQNFLTLAEQTQQQLSPLPEDKLMRLRLRAEDEIFGVALSPSGRFAAWASHDEGRTRVGIKDLMTGRQRLLWRQGERHQDTKAVPTSPVAFVGSDKVATVHHRKGQMELLILTVSGKVFERYPLGDIDQVQYLAFSEDGKKGVLVGSDHGQTDLYQINPRSGKVRKLIDDVADEADPSLDEDGSTVYYASTQLAPADTSGATQQARRLAQRWRIYKLDLTGKAKPMRVAQGPGNLFAPYLHPTLGLVALSDQSGALNLMQTDAGQAWPLTSYATSLERVAYAGKGGRAAALVRYDGRTRLLRLDTLQRLPQPEVPESPWREARPLVSVESAIPTSAKAEPAPSPAPSSVNTTPGPTSSPVPQPAQVPTPPSVAQQAPPASGPPAEADPEVDFRRYQFEDEKASLPSPGGASPTTATPPVTVPGLAPPVVRTPTLQEMRNARKLLQKEVYQPPIMIQGPFGAGKKLSSTSVTTSFIVDPFRGWGLIAEAGMADYFENHRFTVRATPFLDLRSALLSADYLYLKHRVDFSAHFRRNSLFFAQDNFAQKNFLYVYQVGASYPVSRSFRVGAYPYVQQTNFYDLFDNTQVGQKSRSYLGGRLELVYDNSFTNSANITTGTKARLMVERNAGLRASNTSWSQLHIDVRHYQRIHKEITLALRGSAGRFLGNAKKQYMVGGMDNWLFNQFADRPEGPDNPLANTGQFSTEGRVDWFFNPFVTNMRGFDYNAMSGPNFVVFNAELRLPLIKYLYKGPIASNFLRNFQIVGFTDVGSAWSGKSLLGRENSINTNVTARPPFVITTVNTRSPFLIGYGAGVRTLMLGYYVKFDFALGQQDFNQLNRRFYLTLGHDF